MKQIVLLFFVILFEINKQKKKPNFQKMLGDNLKATENKDLVKKMLGLSILNSQKEERLKLKDYLQLKSIKKHQDQEQKQKRRYLRNPSLREDNQTIFQRNQNQGMMENLEQEQEQEMPTNKLEIMRKQVNGQIGNCLQMLEQVRMEINSCNGSGNGNGNEEKEVQHLCEIYRSIRDHVYRSIMETKNLIEQKRRKNGEKLAATIAVFSLQDIGRSYKKQKKRRNHKKMKKNYLSSCGDLSNVS